MREEEENEEIDFLPKTGNFFLGKSEDSQADPRSVHERPTRTLFVRNVNYTVSEKQLRETFQKYGEIKRIFNLIEKRGMAFVTYV